MEELEQLGVKGRYKVRVRQGAEIIEERDWAPNLILDQGMDMFATVRMADVFLYAVCGTDNTPVKDSPAATATWSGTVVTASAATFASTDVGKLIVFSGGQQCYIQGYTDSTHVNVDRSNTIPAATAFSMYRVNQTQLNAEIARTNIYSGNQGDNSTTYTGALVTFQRTFLFPIETGAGHTYYELGFSNIGTAGPNLFARVVLSPGVTVNGPIGTNPGQQLEVVYQLIIGIAPSSANALAPSLGITGYPRTYQINQIQPIVSGFELTINSFVPFFVGDRITITGTSSAYDSPAGSYYTISAVTAGPTSTLIDIAGTSHGSLTPGTPGYVGTVNGYINLSQIAQNYGLAYVAPSGITTLGSGAILSGEPSQLGQMWAADIPFGTAAPVGTSIPSNNYVTASYTLGAYTGKSFQITKSATFPATQSFNFVSFGLGIPDTTQLNQVLRVDCGQRQAKLGGESLTLNITQSWVRSFS